MNVKILVQKIKELVRPMKSIKVDMDKLVANNIGSPVENWKMVTRDLAEIRFRSGKVSYIDVTK